MPNEKHQLRACNVRCSFLAPDKLTLGIIRIFISTTSKNRSEYLTMGNSMKIHWLILLVSLFMAGCATTYNKESFTGGYSVIQLSEDVYKITFSGNAYIGRETVAEYCLLRSSEITIEKGFNYFTLIDGDKYTVDHTASMPIVSQGNIVATGNTAQVSNITYGGGPMSFSKPVSVNIIKLHETKPKGMYYDASIINKSIKSKYGIK